MSDLWPLKGRTALVTGGARRLGRAIALGLAHQGAHVVLHYRHAAEEAAALADQLRRLGVNAWTLQAPLDDPAMAVQLVDQAVALTGGLDILVNNASIFHETGFDQAITDQIIENMRINALAPMMAGRTFARQGREGVIINLLDSRITDYDRQHLPYHLSKRTLHTLTSVMALEFAPLVRVNAVAPGLVLPPEGRDTDYLESLAHTNPLQRYGAEEGVVEAVLFLARSGFVTGQTLFVDGGRHLRGSVYG